MSFDIWSPFLCPQEWGHTESRDHEQDNVQVHEMMRERWSARARSGHNGRHQVEHINTFEEQHSRELSSQHKFTTRRKISWPNRLERGTRLSDKSPGNYEIG